MPINPILSETIFPLDKITISRIRGRLIRKARYHVLSLGGGKQSSTLFLKNLRGEIKPKADFAIFADTQYERYGTYQYLDYLDSLCSEYNFPKIWRVTAGNIRHDMLNDELKFRDNHMPFWVQARDESKKSSQIQRRCSDHYKIAAIRREIRKMFGMKPYDIWIGFSLDEISRRNDSSFPNYQIPRYPLLEQRLTRDDCVKWLEKNGYEIPVKSSCIACPYRSNDSWIDMIENSPEEYFDACDFGMRVKDKMPMIIDKDNNNIKIKRKIYVNRLLIDLNEIDFYKAKKENPKESQECGHGCFL